MGYFGVGYFGVISDDPADLMRVVYLPYDSDSFLPVVQSAARKSGQAGKPARSSQ
jgi:hypothetical protein